MAPHVSLEETLVEVQGSGDAPKAPASRRSSAWLKAARSGVGRESSGDKDGPCKGPEAGEAEPWEMRASWHVEAGSLALPSPTPYLLLWEKQTHEIPARTICHPSIASTVLTGDSAGARNGGDFWVASTEGNTSEVTEKGGDNEGSGQEEV